MKPTVRQLVWIWSITLAVALALTALTIADPPKDAWVSFVLLAFAIVVSAYWLWRNVQLLRRSR